MKQEPNYREYSYDELTKLNTQQLKDMIDVKKVTLADADQKRQTLISNIISLQGLIKEKLD